jgi:hypothetical protein
MQEMEDMLEVVGAPRFVGVIAVIFIIIIIIIIIIDVVIFVVVNYKI